jgi:hypothetical protein
MMQPVKIATLDLDVQIGSWGNSSTSHEIRPSDMTGWILKRVSIHGILC